MERENISVFLNHYNEIILLIVSLSIPLAIILIFVNRSTTGKGLGVRSIQLLTVAMLIPAIFILSFSKTIDSQVTGTLLGTLIGYVLAGISEFKNKQEKNTVEPERRQ